MIFFASHPVYSSSTGSQYHGVIANCAAFAVFCDDSTAYLTNIAQSTTPADDACQLKTRSSADADNRLDAFSGQSRSTNMVPFHM